MRSVHELPKQCFKPWFEWFLFYKLYIFIFVNIINNNIENFKNEKNQKIIYIAGYDRDNNTKFYVEKYK